MRTDVDMSYTFKVGDRVYHRKDPTLTGTVKQVEDNQLSVMVLWDLPEGQYDDNPILHADELDFQWRDHVKPIA